MYAYKPGDLRFLNGVNTKKAGYIPHAEIFPPKLSRLRIPMLPFLG